MATSPALDVPPEPPSKRLKTSNGLPSSSSSPGPVQDLAEQLDQEERQKYVKGKKLGSGQYADVFSAHLASDPTQLVAIKKIKVGAEAKEFGISYDSLREIKFLQELDHPNIIKLYAVFSTKSQNLNLVLEQLPQGDLLKLIQDTTNISYTPADIKSWMLMLMRATHFCHANFVLHRDIKPNNLLIASNGEINQVLQLGVNPERIIFANPCKATSFIRSSAKVGVDMMTFDNTDELYKIARTHPGAKLVVRILTDDSKSLCRLGLKFGAPLVTVPALLAKDAPASKIRRRRQRSLRHVR